MNYQTHKLNSQTHSHILGRQDSVTGDTIKANDEVVFCSACQSVFLVESWEYMDKKHCNQSETLGFVPTPIPTLVAKKKIRGKNLNDKLIFEFGNNIDSSIKLLPILFMSSVIGIGINSSDWFFYIFIAIFSSILLRFSTDALLQNNKVRRFLKLDKKIVRLFETGIELQNNKFYSYFEIEKIEYVKQNNTDFSFKQIDTYLNIYLKNDEIIKQILPSKNYEKTKPFLFALAWTAQFTNLHFYTENTQEKGIINSIQRNYAGRILLENDLQLNETNTTS